MRRTVLLDFSEKSERLLEERLPGLHTFVAHDILKGETILISARRNTNIYHKLFYGHAGEELLLVNVTNYKHNINGKIFFVHQNARPVLGHIREEFKENYPEYSL